MILITNSLNDKGQQLMEIHKEYHNSTTSDLQKKGLLALAENYFRNTTRTWIKAFENADPAVMEAFLVQYSAYRPTAENMLPEISEYIDSLFSAMGIQYYDVGFLNTRNRTQKIFFIERRIGLKASRLIEQTGAKPEDVRSFFNYGHAKAVVKTFVFPAVERSLSKTVKKEKLNVQYELEQTRKYFENLKIRFLLKYPREISETNLMAIGECLKLLNEFKEKNSLLF